MSFSLTDFIGSPTAVIYDNDLRAIKNKLPYYCLVLWLWQLSECEQTINH